MKQVNCPVYEVRCVKNCKTKSGTQRWLCRDCKQSFTQKIDNNAKEFKLFLYWLFSKDVQSKMNGGGRIFRRKTSKFWYIWAMPPNIEQSKYFIYIS